ncbi:MAG TPA: DDE-type integrase/transposase/recombinase [Verrucomicrobiota bacterium]|nr:DDE-type integrase/transposase/recombinase [Verrucomicrobiota bacterium]HNS70374.1 DDE-type integrase/transposase/recombinase [Verrucomicrobiota bacterium]
MQETSSNLRPHERWAHFRFSVIGPLLAAPPSRGELAAQLQDLAAKKWRRPVSGEWVSFGRSTIERWYYKALRAKAGPVEALKRKIRSDHGQHPSVNPQLIEVLVQQHRLHPSWSYQLHADNLAALVEQQPALGPLPAYVSLLRYMKHHGLIKRPRRGPAHSPGARAAEHRFEAREVRSYESEYVNGLWHLDFHHGSLRVLLNDGRWVYPILLGILDDRSRLCCHLQWYLAEGACELCHGLCQAFQKRDLPRSLLFDNGAAMVAEETEAGLGRLGVIFENTLPYSPYQNGKQESFWGQIEGRLLPMLEGVADLTLDQLNEASQAWVELEYNRKVHSEIGQPPLQRFLNDKNVAQPCPATEKLQVAFTREEQRVQRRSDGTLTLESIRFEVPSRFGHLRELWVRYASWDLSAVYLADAKTGAILCRIYPVDKTKNAEGRRALRASAPSAPPPASPGMAPLLQKILQEYALTGLPPAYLPQPQPPQPSV